MQRDLIAGQGPGMHTRAQSSGSLLSPTSKTTCWRHSHRDGSMLVPLSPCGNAEARGIRHATSPERISQRTGRQRQNANSHQWPGYPNQIISARWTVRIQELLSSVGYLTITGHFYYQLCFEMHSWYIFRKFVHSRRAFCHILHLTVFW